MKTAISLVHIKGDSIFLCFKRDVWILPGGKPDAGENDVDCLFRECSEEIPNAKIQIQDFFGLFYGKTPHSETEICIKVYLGTVQGDITPSHEISDTGYKTKAELKNIPVSKITRNIIDTLEEKGFL